MKADEIQGDAPLDVAHSYRDHWLPSLIYEGKSVPVILARSEVAPTRSLILLSSMSATPLSLILLG